MYLDPQYWPNTIIDQHMFLFIKGETFAEGGQRGGQRKVGGHHRGGTQRQQGDPPPIHHIHLLYAGL